VVPGARRPAPRADRPGDPAGQPPPPPPAPPAAALYLYHRFKRDWEDGILKGKVKVARRAKDGEKAKREKGGRATRVGVKGGAVVKNAVGRKMSKKKVLAGGAIKERADLYDL